MIVCWNATVFLLSQTEIKSNLLFKMFESRFEGLSICRVCADPIPLDFPNFVFYVDKAHKKEVKLPLSSCKLYLDMVDPDLQMPPAFCSSFLLKLIILFFVWTAETERRI